ncbi:hydroxysqualene dehydroxylase HpnE [Actinopolymorpha alba]|uniref:hydroxysqualene dehydroxylase HpnE n=1 Tax=Actinopolymorpha alba TaxID=533267 RepID=UPI0003773AC2|nr:hydroxysqualene dehydroxylase HpnE [Actinopolymorpha alba]
MRGPAVVVVGGGLAGIAAAVRLADRGARVTLVEARPHLGGATYSFPRGGLLADTGQHVFLRCYESYRDLLDRMGVSALAPIQERFEIPVLYAGGRQARLRRGRRGPAPLHLAGALAGYRPLGLSHRLRAGTAALALRSVDPDDPVSDRTTFGAWLRAQGQSDRAVERLWGLITVAALNLPPDQASLALAARVFRTALLERPDAADIGIPGVPLRELHAEPAARLLARLGVRVHTKAKVLSIEPTEQVEQAEPSGGSGPAGPGFVLHTRTGELTADAVVVAVPHQAATQLVPATAAPDRDRWAGLGSSPIVNVHVVYDRPVTDLPYAAGLDTPVQWIFDRTRAASVEHGQYLVVSISAADGLADRPADEIRHAYAGALATLFPKARQARLLQSFVTREPHATFRQVPGTAALRPPARTRLPGLALAGAWTGTGWPDTMEGAVRSGLLAADAIDIDSFTRVSRPIEEATP